MKRGVLILSLLLLVVALPAHAELTSVNPIDQLFQQFRSASASWQGVILQEAHRSVIRLQVTQQEHAKIPNAVSSAQMASAR